MEVTPAVSRVFEFLISLLSIGLPGLPPGERDPNLWRGVPADAVVAFEWSGQGAGVAGSTGVDGIAADPEMRALFDALRQSLPQREAQPVSQRTIYDIPAEEVARVLMSRPGCLYVGFAPPESGIPLLQRLRAAIVINGGQQPDMVLRQLQPLLPEWMLRDTRANPAAGGLVTGLAQFRRFGPYLAWGVNLGATDEALARLTSPQPVGLAHTEEFTRRMAAAAVERPGSVLWVHSSAAVDAVLQLIPQVAAVKSKLPLEAAANGFVLVTGVEQGRMIARASCGRAPRPVPTLNADMLRFVPADAHIVLCGPLELDGSLLSGLAGLAADGQAALNQMRESLLAETRVDLGPDVFAAFGSRWTIYSAPSTGGPFGIGPILAVELKQPLLLSAHFPKVMARWSQELARNPRSGWALNVSAAQGQEVYSLRTPELSQQGLLPSWCVTDTHLLFTFQPQPLRSHLRFLDSLQPRFITRLGQDVSFPEGASAWGFIDSPALTQTVWPLLPFAVGRLDSQFNTGAIPSTGAVLRHTLPTTFVAQARPDHWLYECRNPLSLAAPAIAGVVMVEAMEVRRSSRMESSPASSVGLDLGVPDGGNAASPANGVKPAVATQEQPAASTARRLAPALIRAFAPQDVQSLIPAEVFQRLEQGPTPDQQQRRKDRLEKRAQRKGTAP